MKKIFFIMTCVMLLCVGVNAALISNGDFEEGSNWNSNYGTFPSSWFTSMAGPRSNGAYGEPISGYGNGKVAALKKVMDNYYQQILVGVDAGTTNSYTVSYDGGIRYHSSYSKTARNITLRISLWDTTAGVELAGIDVVTPYSSAATSLEARSHALSYDNSGLAGHDLAVRFTNSTSHSIGSANGNAALIDNVVITIPCAADLVNPIPDNSAHVDIDALLEWVSSTLDPSTGNDPNLPSGYDVYIDPNEDKVISMDPLVKKLDNQNQTSIDPVLDFGTTYYWRVVTYHDGNIPTAGYIWSFTTATAEPAVLTSPTDQIVAPGEEAIFEVTGIYETGYAWYKSIDESNASIEDDTLISTDGSVLVLSGDQTQSSEEGYIYCQLINSAGSINSDVASLMTKRQVAQWDFETDLLDFIGNNDASATAPVFAADGIVGLQSLQVTPADASTYASVPLSAELNNSMGFTIEAWVKPAALPSYGGIVSSRGGSPETGVDGGYVIYSHSSGRVGFWLHDGSSWDKVTTSTSSFISVGQWNYVVATFEDGIATVYINGVQGAQQTDRAIKRNMTAPLYIGAGANDEAVANFYFDGLIDQVKIHMGAIDAITVASNYVAQFPEVSICADQMGLTFDADGDCDVDINDVALFASEWLNCNRVAGTESGLLDCN